MAFKTNSLSRSFCTSRVDYNIDRIKELLTTLPKELKDELNYKSIVEYPTLLDLQTNLKANTQLLKDNTGVYIITYLKYNTQYVGQSINQRARLLRHISPGENPKSRIGRAIKKHGIHNFSVVIVIVPNIVTREKLTLLEQFFMDSLQSEYNLAKIAGFSPAGIPKRQLNISPGIGLKMPADFGDRMRTPNKVLGTPISTIHYYIFSIVSFFALKV